VKEIVFITGADRGLGYALTEKYLEMGSFVAAGKFFSHSPSLDSLKKTYPDSLEVIDLDVSDIDSVKSAYSKFKTKFDRLDILINNAGVVGDIKSTIYDEIDYDDIINTIQINTLGPLRMINIFIQSILSSKRKLIVNISSEAGSIENCYRTNWFGYSISKSGLNMESNLLQNELREKGVQVLLFHPGWLRTMMNGKLDERAPTLPEEAAERLVNNINKYKRYNLEHPAYIDNDTGEILPW
jgi:NAD(P)-dependent dehydrogenase (short-subunit alcohol dehydrogenase family)